MPRFNDISRCIWMFVSWRQAYLQGHVQIWFIVSAYVGDVGMAVASNFCGYRVSYQSNNQEVST